MLCGRGQKKGKTALIFAVAVGSRWPAKGAGSEWERSARGCWGGHTSSSIPGPLPPCSACSAPRAGQDWGMPGKSITLAGQACSCDLPSMGSSPCVLPAARGPGREMKLIPGPGCDGNQWPWPAQRLPGDGRTAGPTALEDFGAASQHH